MNAFTEDWLALRESADHHARDASLLVHLSSWLDQPERQTGRNGQHRIVDLGTGTGSNLRYLLPRLGTRQHWQLVDNDPELLEALPARIHSWASRRDMHVESTANRLSLQGVAVQADIDLHTLDLATNVPSLRHSDVVSASALLDLFSRDRIEAIAHEAQAHRTACLFALNYDGRLRCVPEHEDDALVFELFNAHQNRDKGLGAALGPAGGAAMANALRKANFSVIVSRADWSLDAKTAGLKSQLMDGWCAAAIEQSPDDEQRLKAWRQARQIDCEKGRLRICVGHVDVLGMPTRQR